MIERRTGAPELEGELLEGELPEGADVVVLATEGEEPFELAEAVGFEGFVCVWKRRKSTPMHVAETVTSAPAGKLPEIAWSSPMRVTLVRSGRSAGGWPALPGARICAI
jgi:hypothetical protein